MGKGWSPERRAAASAAAKARMAPMEGSTAVAEPTPAITATVAYEQRPKRFKRPDDGFHYVMVEKKPSMNELDYQGYRLEDYEDMQHVPEMSTRLHDFYRIPREKFLAKRKEKGDKSRKGAQAPVQADIRAEGGNITANTASVAAKQSPQEFFGEQTESE